MKFVTYATRDSTEDGSHVGVLADGLVHQVIGGTRLMDLLGDPELLGVEGRRALASKSSAIPLDEVQLGAPVPRPPSVRDFMTFEAHVAGVASGGGGEPPKVWYRQPLFYFSNPQAVVGPYDDVAMPPATVRFDFELEVAAIVGRGGSNLTVEQASDAIAGYTILNDWSARDLQFREMQGHLGPAKGKDSALTLGPWLVTSDELEPWRNGPSFSLEMEVEINGEPFGRDRLDHMAWSFSQMVSYASRGTTLVPGDVLGSGTCGSGCLAEAWSRNGLDSHPALEPGDVVTMRVEQLGEISNRVVAPLPLHDIGAPRTAAPDEVRR